MKSLTLEKARNYETEMDEKSQKEKRPDFHLCARTGWMNDPNGFSSYNGKYHLFYQYYPYETRWNSMHWAHAVTEDFITWTHFPCALAPDQPYDRGGCFSGTAVADGERHILIYTGVEFPKNGLRPRQTQNVAVGDGMEYDKIPENPVITESMLPDGSSPFDFRDPKIWKEDGRFYAAVGNIAADGYGQILLYSSENLVHWRYEGILEQNTEHLGIMWECPDFFELDGRYILMVSPQFMTAEELKFHNGNGTIFFEGRYDRKNHRFEKSEKDAEPVDYGLDFYAPQTVLAEDGRRIMIAWMRNWDVDLLPEEFSWSAMMTIPRELFWKQGQLCQRPVRELENYYTEKKIRIIDSIEGGSFIPGRDVKEEADCLGKSYRGIEGRQFDMTIEVEEGDYQRLEIDVAAGEHYRTILFYEPEISVVTLDRLYSGHKHDSLSQRSMYVRKQDGRIKLRLIMDLYGIEIFVNDGEQAMSALVYTDLHMDQIRFSSRGRVHITAEYHEIKKD